MITGSSKKRRILIIGLIVSSICVVIAIAVIAVIAMTAESSKTGKPSKASPTADQESTALTFSDTGILVEYSSQPAWYSSGEDQASGTEITIYNDGTAEIRNVPVVVRANQEIPSESFTIDSDAVAYLQKEIRESDFIHLRQDVSTDSCDGAYVHIAVHTNETTHACGGLNPNDPQFERVWNAIWDVIPEAVLEKFNAKEEAYYVDLTMGEVSVDQ